MTIATWPRLFALTLALVGWCCAASVALAADADRVTSGSSLIVLRADALEARKVRAEWAGAEAERGADVRHLVEAAPGSMTEWDLAGGDLRVLRSAIVRHDGRLTLDGPAGRIELDGIVMHIEDGASRAYVADAAGRVVLRLDDLQVGTDATGGSVLIEGTLTLTAVSAQALGADATAHEPIGFLSTRAVLAGAGPSESEPAWGPRAAGTTCGSGDGPDVIVGQLPQVSSYGSVGGIAAFAVGTVSCNIGNTELLWVYNQNRHPVIAQNMYRLKSGRFEQVGMSWLKHGFAALTGNGCSCGCEDPGTSQRLGVGCSDPYESGLNGNQFYLGPRSEVNPHTGDFAYPFADIDSSGNAIYKRLQVHIADLDPGQSGGGLYFVEGQYVTPDDATAGNADNNASYRRVAISGAGASWTASFSGMPTTVRGAAAIRAWRANDPAVVETDVRVPEEGLVILAAKAESLGGGMWHYEYAVQNLNSERAIRGLTVPVAASAVVQNIGFHDVDYHSGEPFDGTDWPGVRAGDTVGWSTAAYATDPNANALRWGSLYNFRFDANQPPQPATVAFRLFKPGKPGLPDVVFAMTIGPAGAALDCNTNGVADATDLAGGASQDCNANAVPDECEDFLAVRLAAVQVASGLSAPVAAAAPPGDETRLFICEQNTGRVRLLKNGLLQAAPFLDIGSLISSGGERGLLGIAFHPNYAGNGHFFVHYTNSGGHSVVARYTVSGNPDVANASSALVLKTITQDAATHNGGQLAFGPDGDLYVGMGDGGVAGDGLNRAQNVNSLLGKILRLDVDAAAPYVPGDNPFVGVTGLDEIWALGLRNPWRFSFDRLTGDLYLADVGEGSREEIDFAPATSTGGENYGWRCYEGSQAYNLAGCGPVGGYVFPLYEYSHAGGACAVIGGYVYRGCALPQLRGTYFFADFCAGWVKSFRHADGDAAPPVAQDRTFELGALDGAITSFAEDAAGELYLLTDAGKVYRIEAADSGAAVCGNSAIEYGEQCDDGNTSFGDGCDEHCQLEGAGADVCGAALPLCPDASVVGSTAGAGSDGSATCGDAAGSPAHWYIYQPVADGYAEFATCGSEFDTVVSVHAACPGGAGTQLVCNDDGCGNVAARAVVAVDAGQSYWVRVAGYDGAVGDYTLSVAGPGCSAVCGNGVVELGEDCEPAGTNGCSAICTFNVCAQELFSEAFEAGAPPGWSLHAAGSTASAGVWTVANPDGTNTGGDLVQPDSAFDGNGCAFTAANSALASGDVDGGVTYLVSPMYDLSGLANAKLRYARWFYNGTLGDDAGDFFIAQVSANNGGSWTTLELLNDGVQANAWTQADFELAPLIALTDQVRVRFGVADGVAIDGLIEGAIDAFVLSTCTDCNSNGVDDGDDLANGASTDINENQVPDDCEATGNPLRGGAMYDHWQHVVPAASPTGDHPLWAFRPDLSSNPRTGADTWRCKECHGWDYRGVDGAYATGSHRTGFPGIAGSTLSEADLITLLTAPPTNDGGPGVLNGHDYGSVMSPVYIRDLVAFVRVGVVDTPTYIDGGGAFIGSAPSGQAKYTTNFGGPSCRNCHGNDGTNINFGTPLAPVWLGHIAADNPWEFLHKTRFGQPGSSMPQFLAHGTTQGASDIGAYVQQNFPTQCVTDSHCDDGNDCNGAESCGASGCVPGVFAGCDVGCDQDCDVDLADFAILQRCFTDAVGPGPAAYPPGCECYDYNADGDVDGADFATFRTSLSGADVPAAGCNGP